MIWVERYKPAAAVQAHLLLAGLMWTSVGTALVGFGGRWLWQLPTPAASQGAAGLLQYIQYPLPYYILATVEKRCILDLNQEGHEYLQKLLQFQIILLLVLICLE